LPELRALHELVAGRSDAHAQWLAEVARELSSGKAEP
jgi:hypothetical protein